MSCDDLLLRRSDAYHYKTLPNFQNLQPVQSKTGFRIEFGGGGLGVPSRGSLLSRSIPGPSGRASIQKYLEKRWDKATFGSIKKSIEYHVGKHGKGLSAAEYTQKAIKAFKDNTAVREVTTDLQGRTAIKVVSKEGTGLFTPHGKIIWFHPKM